MRRGIPPALAVALIAPVAAHAASYKLTLPCDAFYHAYLAGGRDMAMLCKSGKVQFLALPSGRRLKVLDRQHVSDFAFSADGRRFAILRPGGRVTVFSADGKPQKSFEAGRNMVTVRFFGDNRFIVNRTIWDIATGRPIRTLEVSFSIINAVARSRDGKHLATAGGDTVVRLYNAQSWKLTHRYTGLKLEPFSLAFTKGGTRLAVGGANERIILLNTATGRAVKAFPQSGPKGAYIRRIEPIGGHGWGAVEYVDLRSNKSIGWQYVNLNTGAAKPACAGSTDLSVAGDTVWCFRVKGRTLIARSETPPHG